MSYEASMTGTIYLKRLNEQQKEDMARSLAKEFGDPTAKYPSLSAPFCDGMCHCYDDNSGLFIDISAYDNYRDDEWGIFYGILEQYIDFSKESQVEFVGEDYSMWRFRFTKNGLVEDAGHVVYDINEYENTL